MLTPGSIRLGRASATLASSLMNASWPMSASAHSPLYVCMYKYIYIYTHTQHTHTHTHTPCTSNAQAAFACAAVLRLPWLRSSLNSRLEPLSLCQTADRGRWKSKGLPTIPQVSNEQIMLASAGRSFKNLRSPRRDSSREQ